MAFLFSHVLFHNWRPLSSSLQVGSIVILILILFVSKPNVIGRRWGRSQKVGPRTISIELWTTSNPVLKSSPLDKPHQLMKLVIHKSCSHDAHLRLTQLAMFPHLMHLHIALTTSRSQHHVSLTFSHPKDQDLGLQWMAEVFEV